jgi:hypothetical protein
MTARYTVEGWNNCGPVRILEPSSPERALALAERLKRDGFSHISLTNIDTGAQVDLATFQHEFAGTHDGEGNVGTRV